MSVVRPKVFVSYYHRGDQSYYETFNAVFHHQFDLVIDSSLDRTLDSGDLSYVYQRIREEYLTGVSCTIVLCGPDTYKRKFVDWEIKASLDKQHGILAIKLPTNPDWNCPPRLADNIESGYATHCDWNELLANPDLLAVYIGWANDKSPSLIVNDRDMRRTDG